MDVWRLLAAVVRRWYVVVPLLGVTLLAALSVGSWVPPEYRSSAVIGTAPSSVPAGPDAAVEVDNPYASLTYTAALLAYVLESSAVREELVAAGLSSDYEVSPVPRSSFLGIEVTADDPALAVETGRGVVEKARQVLEQRQAEARTPQSRFVTIDVLDEADDVAASVSSQFQALAAVLAAGGVLSFLATVLLDDVLLLRRRNRRAVSGSAMGESAGSSGVAAGSRAATDDAATELLRHQALPASASNGSAQQAPRPRG